jgi:5-methylcytosine-specific restriction protein A
MPKRRRDFSKTVKRDAAARAKGRCEQCTARLSYGQFHYDHVLPDALGGEPLLDNCQVLCVTCHRLKTGHADAQRISKSRRQRDHAIGIKPERTIRRWRKFNGQAVWAPKWR